MKADPLLLEEGYGIFLSAMIGPTKDDRTIAGLSAFAAFVLRQRRSVTGGMVEAAIKQVEESAGWCPLTPAGVRAMLEAAERERVRGQ